MELQQNSLVPLYQQLEEEIKSAIKNLQFKYGDQIPPEPELSARYKVSRITVRKAISDLVNDGYLVKKQGKGTYVNKRKIQRKIEHLLSFSDACNLNGMKATSVVIKKEILVPSIEEKKILQLEEDDQILYTQRVRLADGDPIMFENNYYSYKRFGFLLKENLEGSLYILLKTKYGITPNDSPGSSLEIVCANDDSAKILQVPNGEPLFYMKCNIYDTEKRPIYIGKQYIVGERYKFYIP